MRGSMAYKQLLRVLSAAAVLKCYHALLPVLPNPCRKRPRQLHHCQSSQLSCKHTSSSSPPTSSRITSSTAALVSPTTATSHSALLMLLGPGPACQPSPPPPAPQPLQPPPPGPLGPEPPAYASELTPPPMASEVLTSAQGPLPAAAKCLSAAEARPRRDCQLLCWLCAITGIRVRPGRTFAAECVRACGHVRAEHNGWMGKDAIYMLSIGVVLPMDH